MLLHTGLYWYKLHCTHFSARRYLKKDLDMHSHIESRLRWIPGDLGSHQTWFVKGRTMIVKVNVDLWSTVYCRPWECSSTRNTLTRTLTCQLFMIWLLDSNSLANTNYANIIFPGFQWVKLVRPIYMYPHLDSLTRMVLFLTKSSIARNQVN